MTVKEARIQFINHLSSLYPSEEITAISMLVFHHFMGLNRSEVLLKPNTLVAEQLKVQIYDIIEQLKLFKPIQYILKSTFFYELPLFVDESVLIPRPETEELVHWIIIENKLVSPDILDICTGSGCIALALAKNISNSTVVGLDISKSALEVARKNAVENDLTVDFRESDILNTHSIESLKFDIIVSNPPYVTNKQKELMSVNVLRYEPHIALFVPDTNPVIFYEVIAKFARNNLKNNGLLFLEINEDLPDETIQVVQKEGFNTELRKDLNNKFRMLKAWRHD